MAGLYWFVLIVSRERLAYTGLFDGMPMLACAMVQVDDCISPVRILREY